MARVIHTVGTSDRSPQEFTDLLASYEVEVVVDVRRFPTSRFQHFRGEKLAALLRGVGLEYVRLGEELGGYRRGGYQDFTITPEFEKGLGRVQDIASTRTVALLCAERFPWRCHRRFIARKLEERGWEVNHIIDRRKSWRPAKPAEESGQLPLPFNSDDLADGCFPP